MATSIKKIIQLLNESPLPAEKIFFPPTEDIVWYEVNVASYIMHLAKSESADFFNKIKNVHTLDTYLDPQRIAAYLNEELRKQRSMDWTPIKSVALSKMIQLNYMLSISLDSRAVAALKQLLDIDAVCADKLSENEESASLSVENWLDLVKKRQLAKLSSEKSSEIESSNEKSVPSLIDLGQFKVERLKEPPQKIEESSKSSESSVVDKDKSGSYVM